MRKMRHRPRCIQSVNQQKNLFNFENKLAFSKRGQNLLISQSISLEWIIKILSTKMLTKLGGVF